MHARRSQWPVPWRRQRQKLRHRQRRRLRWLLTSLDGADKCLCFSLSFSLYVCVYVVGLSLDKNNNNNNDCHWNWPLKWRLGGFWLLFWLVLYVNCCPSVAAAGKTICDLRSLLMLPLLLCVYYLRLFLANETIWMRINFNPQQNKLDSINRSHAASAQQLSLSLSAIWTPIESRFCYFALHTHRYTYLQTHTHLSHNH